MAASFLFYDLETSGLSAHSSRIMQFAGRRTDMDLNPIGEPFNLLIKMTEDTLPDPDAVFVTGITPQATIADGITEVEFLRIFTEQIAPPDTIFVGFNTVRFDDEFVRCLHYRNFYDPYEWQWQDKRSRWDILDVVRMTRALRPEGIEWPFDSSGKPTNRLELMTALNKLDHAHAHDALSDVDATIAVARLIYNKHQKLFEYLLKMRDKKAVAEFVKTNDIFVYTSGRYAAEYDKTTVVTPICDHPKRSGCSLVYDLRHDPAQYLAMSAEQLAEAWRWKKDRDEPRLPVKEMAYNKCPAIAPMGVLDAASLDRLKLDLSVIARHRALLKGKDFQEKLCKALDILETQKQTNMWADEQGVDGQMYDGFFEAGDKAAMRMVRAADPAELGDLADNFEDNRLKALLPLYKARNYPKLLTSEERTAWEQFCYQRLMGKGQQSRMAAYFARLQEMAGYENLTGHQQYLLEELRLYAESIMPVGAEA